MNQELEIDANAVIQNLSQMLSEANVTIAILKAQMASAQGDSDG